MMGDRDRTAMQTAFALVAAVVLIGCDAGLGLDETSSQAPGGPVAAAAGQVDIAAPEVFQAAEKGLWDGRPSLGGVWVAHPDAQDPERVRIINRVNGQQVIGALFRRERDLPGPPLQVSSDAAEALGMLAGAPADLEVTALRRQEPPAPTAVDTPPPEGATPQEGETDAEPQAAAPVPQAASSGPPEAGAVAQATSAIVAGAAVAPATPAGAIATTSLDALSGTPAPVADGAPLSALRNPFVQLGLFDQETNAVEAAQALADQRLPARVVISSGGNAWRLLLGPASSGAEQQSLLARAVAAGFEDAYLVRS